LLVLVTEEVDKEEKAGADARRGGRRRVQEEEGAGGTTPALITSDSGSPSLALTSTNRPRERQR
jgi:hypothetical protein